MLEIRIAEEKDIKDVCKLYNDLLDYMGVNNPPRWTKGKYPSDAFIEEVIGNKTMHIGINDGEIVSAMVLDHSFADGYENVSWDIDVPLNEVISIHTLCVKGECAGQGFASEMLKYTIDFTRKIGCKAIRLDVIDGNAGANKLYKKNGFVCKGVHKIYYDSTDCTDFTMYEYVV